MLTKNEINSLSLSPTKKDFVQIWNELLEVASKLSERWDPTSTNESDPGIVILKALTGIADKLNYNIDKNTLEAFMPTAAQEDSMRKLCDMLGYTMKYYQSAQTEVTIKYHNPAPEKEEEEAMKDPGLLIPKFTVITNGDQDISYFTINQTPYYISAVSPSQTLLCMEGQIVKCESLGDNNVITANQISENNRFYLPETQIAENGIFVYNVFNGEAVGGSALEDGAQWEKVDNLNIQPRGTRAFKFGFDSYESRPYIEFPEDYSELFNEGIFIYYTRTSGVNGNVSARTLTQLELPNTKGWSDVSAESFSVENVFAATSGANAETIKQAYNNFKKTIGTFETLVTCRDYMNKIYSMVNKYNKPFVSNILVTDIRNDLNRAVTICSCDEAGIFYKETPLIEEITTQQKLKIPVATTVSTDVLITANKPVFNKETSAWHVGSLSGITLAKTKLVPGTSNFNISMGSDLPEEENIKELDGYWAIVQNGETYKTSLASREHVSIPVSATIDKIVETTEERPAIDHFDLVFYPFKSYNQIKTDVKDVRAVYDASFTYSANNLKTIQDNIDAANTKTIAHNIVKPRIGDLVSINNYLKLNATIATNSKITVEEGSIIVDKIKIALANAFNMRELDFGEEIPFDSIVDVIEKADSRIRVASLNDPALYTTFSVLADENGTITEYAVGSSWLNDEAVAATGRLKKTMTDASGTKRTISTFNTAEAKEIYNKLAVRNVLAGRVPLFNYNNTFKTSFSEGAYQITKVVPEAEVPEDILIKVAVDDENPYAIWVDDGITYTGRYDFEAGEAIYTVTSVPRENDIEYSVITNINGNDITDIKTSCKILADAADPNSITDVTLSSGEFIRFRAPNLTTEKTYPAYVNYHLELDKALLADPMPAEATSLFDILNSDRLSWSADHKDIKWQRVLDYFNTVDAANKSAYKKRFTLAQTVSAYKPVSDAQTDPGKGEITLSLDVNNTSSDQLEYTAEALMALSGCAKLLNENFEARLEWSPADDETAPAGEVPLKVKLDFVNPFITNADVLTSIRDAVDAAIETYRTSLPTECSWTISFDFECVPFEAKSLSKWEAFIRSCAENISNEAFKYQVLDFAPIDENNTIFWRTFGEGYDIGKYVSINTEKLLKFDKNYFGLLPENSLAGIYLIENIGIDAAPAVIKNNEEYKLRQNERLYIEYTPSTTTEDGTTQELSAVTEIYGEGTIIRPSGFENGLLDSEVSAALGSNAHKNVTFAVDGSNSVQVSMHSLGANEQIEIRDLAKVELSKESFKNSSAIYVYKNFNGCEELETRTVKDGKRINNNYTLKDGEYIFYTDHKKAELAYFTSGTQVTLSGNLVLPQFEVIELASIFEVSGIQEIPWYYLPISGNDKIVFQEFQYVTIGPEDTLKSLILSDVKTDTEGNVKNYLSDEWQYCSDVRYTLAGEPDNVLDLPPISLHDDRKGNGWEVSSALELNVSPSDAQILRNTDKLQTSLIVNEISAGGSGTKNMTITPAAGYPVSFKTNLACYGVGNKINIEDVYANPNKLTSFQLKLFATDTPVIVETAPGTVLPYNKDIADIVTWSGEPLIQKEYAALWNQVSLEQIRTGAEKDLALRLPVNLLPNTYGVFSIYVDTAKTSNQEAWIEVIPGTKRTDFELLNAEARWYPENDTQLPTRLFLNPGINCIRVNKTGRIFIKASCESEGVLYFDDIRLVNTKPIVYVDANSKPVTKFTQGLNIEQLGYFDTSTGADKMLNMQKADLVDGAYKEIDQIIQKADDTFVTDYKQLTSYLPKVKSLVDYETRINEDISAIQKLNAVNNLKPIIEVYNSVKEKLAKKEELLKVIDNNKDMSDIVQKLGNLLESSYAADTAEQQILAELAKLESTIISDLEKLADGVILADYSDYVTANGTDDELVKAAWPDIRRLAADYIAVSWYEQLSDIANDFEQATGSEAKVKIAAALEELRNAELAETRAKLLTAINQLAATLDRDAVNTLLEQMTSTAIEQNYAALITYVDKLRDSLTIDDVKLIASELSIAASEGDDTRLSNLVTELENAVNATDDTKVSVLEEIDALRAYVSDLLLIQDPSYMTAVMKKVADLKDSVTTYYDSSLTSLIGTGGGDGGILVELVDALTTPTAISALIATLSSGEDAAAGEASARLTAACNSYTDQLIDLESANAKSMATENSIASSFINAAVIAVWPAYLKARAIEAVSSINNIFNDAILIKTDYVTSVSNFNVLTGSFTDSLSAVVKVTDFELLLSDVDRVICIKEQKAADEILIKKVSTLIPIPEKLIADSDNSVIDNLVDKLLSNNTDVIQKQRLTAELREELNRAIKLDTDLFSIIANLLCPNITDIEATVAKDSFYTELLNELATVKSSFLTTDADAYGFIVDNLNFVFDDFAYQKLLDQDSITDFKEALLEFVREERPSLLPMQVKAELADIVDALTKLNIMNNDLNTFATADRGADTVTAKTFSDLTINNKDIKDIVDTLVTELSSYANEVKAGYEEAFAIVALEEQLLEDIRAIDTNRDFYYNVPVESSLAIEFNEDDKELNTLLNPLTNYDINNINNNFVISKLDIDYLDKGIKLARSSRLN